jgi:hypothetical protein
VEENVREIVHVAVHRMKGPLVVRAEAEAVTEAEAGVTAVIEIVIVIEDHVVILVMNHGKEVLHLHQMIVDVMLLHLHPLRPLRRSVKRTETRETALLLLLLVEVVVDHLQEVKEKQEKTRRRRNTIVALAHPPAPEIAPVAVVDRRDERLVSARLVSRMDNCRSLLGGDAVMVLFSLLLLK